MLRANFTVETALKPGSICTADLKSWKFSPQLQIFVLALARHAGRGVAWGLGMAVWRGFFLQPRFPLNNIVFMPLQPGWETGAAEGRKKKEYLNSYPTVSQRRGFAVKSEMSKVLLLHCVGRAVSVPPTFSFACFCGV